MPRRKIKPQERAEKSNAIQGYQDKIAYKIYGAQLKTDLTGFFIDTKQADITRFINNVKKIDVSDIGEKIVANGENIKEQVALMLDIAVAKRTI